MLSHFSASKIEISYQARQPEIIYWQLQELPFGRILIGKDEHQIFRFIFFVDTHSPEELLLYWQNKWPKTKFLYQPDAQLPRNQTPPFFPLDSTKSYKAAIQATAFQQKVWSALCGIPHGVVKTYGEIAKLLNNPNASRAVGAACGANPLPLLIPCHRVIAANHQIGGFTANLNIKYYLLEQEGFRINRATGNIQPAKLNKV